MTTVDDRFVRCIVDSVNDILDGVCDPVRAAAGIRRIFLEQNSATPDNVASIGLIEVGEATKPGGNVSIGLTIGSEHLSLSHVFWKAVETDQVSALIRQEFPSISVQEADAVLRICVVILTNLEGLRRASGEGG